MALDDDLKSEVAKIFREQWTTRKGQVVPEPTDLKLSNDAVEFESATVLYADLSGSTSMVNSSSWTFAAEVYKTFLYCAAKIVRAEGGTITSYDGDRIMGIFVGETPNTRAARCGLKINHAVTQIINPALKSQYKNSNFTVKQVVGIDTSSIRAARTGARGDNDIVWVGKAANHAAKLTELNLSETTWITKAVYDKLPDAVKLGGQNNLPMWKSYKWTQNGDLSIYGSTWRWAV
ncbi:MAG: adenylate/guanylate cyclase domain-containing protein [Hyphomicrobium sp.]|nr:adenylate/guanylate cyclase domain-containing protein [Hyphomicrobium sp.]